MLGTSHSTNRKHNKQDDELLIIGYIRQHTFCGDIPQISHAICKVYLHVCVYLGSMVYTTDKAVKAQSTINSKAVSIFEQLKHLSIKMSEIIRNNEKLITKRHKAHKMSSLRLHPPLELKNVSEKIQCVEMELTEAKSALDAALQALSNIRSLRRRLDEIKSIKRPPKVVGIVFEAVAAILCDSNRRLKREKDKANALKLVYGYTRLLPVELTYLIHTFHFVPRYTRSIFKVKCWRDIQRMISLPQFIPTILNFNTNDITKKTRKKVSRQYLSDDDFTFERVNKASKVAGPLVLWVKSQIKYSHLLDSVEPMQKEINNLSEKQKYVDRVYNMVIEMELMDMIEI